MPGDFERISDSAPDQRSPRDEIVNAADVVRGCREDIVESGPLWISRLETVSVDVAPACTETTVRERDDASLGWFGRGAETDR
jgi:hypothetical protein